VSSRPQRFVLVTQHNLRQISFLVINNMDKFFATGRVYAVAGASKDPSKYGHKVLKWYVDRNLPVTPINYRKDTILGYESVENIKDLPVGHGQSIGLSVVTPPAVTKQLLQDVQTMNGRVHAVWLQPGTYDAEVIELAKQVVPVVIQDCVLVNGDNFLSKL
jgi:uncharacterized protein